MEKKASTNASCENFRGRFREHSTEAYNDINLLPRAAMAAMIFCGVPLTLGYLNFVTCTLTRWHSSHSLPCASTYSKISRVFILSSNKTDRSSHGNKTPLIIHGINPHYSTKKKPPLNLLNSTTDLTLIAVFMYDLFQRHKCNTLYVHRLLNTPDLKRKQLVGMRRRQ